MPPRIRRTPEQARTVILQAATMRLEKYGIRGLNIKDVAKDTGINHGTLLHHFGSADGMRAALLTNLSEQLIDDMAKILNSGVEPNQLIVELFRLMSHSGQIKLLAWRALEEFETDEVVGIGSERSVGLLREIVEGVADKLQTGDAELARNLIFLAVSSAIGWGICGANFKSALGMNANEQDEFPMWVGSQLSSLFS